MSLGYTLRMQICLFYDGPDAPAFFKGEKPQLLMNISRVPCVGEILRIKRNTIFDFKVLEVRHLNAQDPIQAEVLVLLQRGPLW